MKKVNKSAEPRKLLAYRTQSPHQTWEHFASSKGRRKQVQKQIISDQSGLCAYCEEIFFQQKREFTVEHFHPKSHTTSQNNYHLMWDNLLGVCNGGEQSGKSEHSCGVAKQDQNIAILNPLLDIPQTPRLFTYGRDGEMSVDRLACPQHLQHKAQNSIKELGLNATRLKLIRSEVIKKLRDEIVELTKNGASLDDALEQLSSETLIKSHEGHWPPFFTCIRWFLADKAEDHLLQTINYNG